MVRRTHAVPLVLACGGICLPLLAVFVVPMPVWAGQPAPRPGLIPTAAESLDWLGMLAALGIVAFLCLPFRPYCLALRAVTGGISTRLLLSLTTLVASVGLLIYPRFGSDVFDYAAYERLWVVYGDNPLLAVVANRPGDWLAPFVNIPDRTPAYGPLWAIATWPIVQLAGDSAAAEVVGYKLLSVIAYVACCGLIWSTVEAPRRQRALLVFAWSPLVVFEVLGKVHNDSIVALSVLGMLWLAGRGRFTRGVLALVVGAMVKVTPLALAPLMAMRIWRHAGWRGLMPTILASAFVAAVGYAPFWAGPRTLLAVWQQTSGAGWSLATLVSFGSSQLIGVSGGLPIRLVFGAVWAGVCWLLVTRHRLERTTDLAASSGWLLLATLLLLTGAVYGHYFVPAVALAAVAGDAQLERAVLWLSIGGLAVYGVGLLGWLFDPRWIGSIEYQVVGSLVVLGPAVVVVLIDCWRGWAMPRPAVVAALILRRRT